MGKITCIHGVKVGMCRCPNDNHGGTGQCPPECRAARLSELQEYGVKQAKKPKCPDCGRKVPEIVKTSGVCWKCHVGSVQKGKLK